MTETTRSPAKIKRTPVKAKNTKVIPIKPEQEKRPTINVPDELRDLNQWLCWEKIPIPGTDDFKKKPFDPVTGKSTGWNDPGSMRPFKVAHERYLTGGKADGIAFVPTEDEGLVFIDFDEVINQDDSAFLPPKISEILDKLKTLTEKSPSGTGLHSMCRIIGKKPAGTKMSFKNELGIEIFLRFPVTMTGETYKPDKYGAEITDCTEAIHKLIEEGNELRGSKGEEDFDPEDMVGESSLTDEEVIEKAKAAKNGKKFEKLWRGEWKADYPDEKQSGADQALINILTYWCNGDREQIDRLFRESGLYRPKWDQKHRSDGATYGGMTTETALKTVKERYTEKPDDDKYEILPEAAETEETPLPEIEFPPIMSGVAGYFAEVYSEHLESPPHFLYMSFLTCLGNMLGDRLTLESEITPQPRLYTLLLGESATVRKSTTIQHTTKLFREIPGRDRLHLCWGIGSPEGLQELFIDNDRLLLCFDEFKSFVSKCQIQGSVMLPCVNTLFESNHYENAVKKRNISLSNAHLSILAASTVNTYKNTWNPQFTDIGFNNRLFLVPGNAEKKFSIPRPIPAADKILIQSKIVRILKRASKARLTYSITRDARRLFHGWYVGVENSIHSARLDTYAMRLMPLLAVNEGKGEVDVQITEKVIALCDWQLKARKICAPIDAVNQIAKMEELIRRALKQQGPLTMRDLKRFTNVYRHGLWAFKMALKNLEDAGEIGSEGKKKKLRK